MVEDKVRRVGAQPLKIPLRPGNPLNVLLLLALLVPLYSSPVNSKILGFRDSNSRYLVVGNKSSIRVIRELIQDDNRREVIQTLKFTPGLVDFDLNCSPNHCYLVAVSNATKGNVHFYRWLRTQFNTLKENEHSKDSFARPRAVKIIRINRSFYVAIAQDQYHLSPMAMDEDGPKFIGCAIMKFSRIHDRDGETTEVTYHQFIKLPFNPRFVNHFVTISTNNMSDPRAISPSRNHHLIFSTQPDWTTGGGDVRSFIWSPLNDYFWPYRIPREADVKQTLPGTQALKFPDLPIPNQTDVMRQQDYMGAVENCFHHLQRLLADRELKSRQMIESSETIWQVPRADRPYDYAPGLRNVSARVLVHGNVIVRGQVIDSPKVSLITRWFQANIQSMAEDQLGRLIQSYSPPIIQNSITQARLRLQSISKNLEDAYLPESNPINGKPTYTGEIRFLGGIQADEVVLQSVANSDVRLNGIPFRQLENELVSLNGAQNIGGRVVFTGKVVADRLEIHGLINGLYHLRDALDITSDRVQVIELTDPNQVLQTPGFAAADFKSVSASDLILAHNATFNAIRLVDFITRDNRTQVITGRKTFKYLSMSRLNLAHSAVQLNGYNISRIGQNAILLRPGLGAAPHQSVLGDHHVTFLKPIRANKLILNGLVNHHINITSLIYDSVKTNSFEVQQIFGQKNFLNGLKIDQLDTDGTLNGIKVNQVFNLNPEPPVARQPRFANISFRQTPQDVEVMGEFHFKSPVRVLGSVNANLVNGIDLTRRAIRRLPFSATQFGGDDPKLSPQIVRGHKTFYRPMRIINDIRLIDPAQASLLTNSTRIPYPLINGVDMRAITEGLARQMQQPTPILVENFEIEGNLEFPHPNGSSQVTFGNYTNCPLDFIRSRALLGGADNQILEAPIRVNSLRAKNILVDSNALNGLSFPSDFILRTDPAQSSGSLLTETVYGVKTFEHLVVSPSLSFASRPDLQNNVQNSNWGSGSVVFEPGVSINQVPWSELQSFMTHERNLNSTGEKIYNTINVFGNLYVKRINGHYWPEDILLRSVSSTIGESSVLFHKRIYSHLIFTNSSNLNVENQLVLRGPVQLNGRMNGVNLTEFSRSSATYGDKDLFSSGRPIRNKIFVGGLTVKGEIRSSGTIDNVNIEEMKNRVALIKPSNKQVVITSQKVFMSDVWFDGPIRMVYMNELPMDNYLSRIRFEPDGITLRVRNKKTITGALRINSNLFVYGLINGIDFGELKARAVSLSPTEDEVVFNRTLILEGDAYMDNLWIERDGTINSVKLTNLLPLRNVIDIQNPRIAFRPHANITEVHGGLDDCQVRCEIAHQASYPMQASIRKPFSIRYEKSRPVKRSHPVDSANIEMQLDSLRSRFISINLVRLSESANLVVGFIDAPTNDVSSLIIPDQDSSHQLVNQRRDYTPLDQIDFLISTSATIYPLSVGVLPDYRGRNLTTVSYLKGNHTIEASVLPIERPKSAKFIESTQTLFLMVSQELPDMCERTQNLNSLSHGDGVHVYVFQAFSPDSTSRQAAYFDLYQTIDLDGVDSFERFSFHGSSYVLAISRASNRIYVLLLRGYIGFHIVSFIDAPGIETVTVMYSTDHKPMLVIHQTDGTHRVMEPVII